MAKLEQIPNERSAMEGNVHVEIKYCVAWGYFPTAAWMATELWGEFAGDVAITLTPVGDGRLELYLDGDLILDRKADGGKYPGLDSVREIKSKVAKKVEFSQTTT